MYQCLSEHPEVFTASPKELHYFNGRYDRGDEWYFQHFTPGPEHKAWGEATPLYLSWTTDDASAATRLARIAPDCKLICCLRDPVDRAYSQWERWGEGRDSFETAVEHNYGDILGLGLYAKHLKRWFQHFSRDQFLIQLHGGVIDDNARAVREVYAHLGVYPSYQPSWLGQAYNSVVLPQLQNLLRRLRLGKVIDIVRGTVLGRLIRQSVYAEKKKTQASRKDMTSEMKEKLASYYAEPNEELETLLNVDVSHWTTP